MTISEDVTEMEDNEEMKNWKATHLQIALVTSKGKVVYDPPHSMYDDDIQKNVKSILALLELPCKAKTKKGEVKIKCASDLGSFSDAEAQLHMAKEVANTVIGVRQYQDRTVGT